MKRISAVVLTAALAVVGCGEKSEAPGEAARSSQQRIVAAAPAADLKSAVTGATDFAFALHRELAKEEDGNLFFSPYSITTALAMAYAGAAGDTQRAFESTLRMTPTLASYHRAMNDLDTQLESRGQGAKAADGKAFRLNSLNQPFAQKGLVLEAPFLDTLAQEYGGEVRLLDFETKPEPSREAINGWVEGATENRIQDLLQPGSIDSSTQLVLVNAIYFNAAWKKAFDEGLTTSAPFNAPAGQVNAQMMRAPAVEARGGQLEGVELVELPYDGDELSMLLLVPATGELGALEAKLQPAWLEQANAELSSETLNLTMPSFEMKKQHSLATALRTMGLGIAFSGEADFSGITTQEQLFISDVIHQAFVKVNEAGTEAAAATAVVFERTSAVPTVRTVTIDRPFLFLIRDNATGAVVFMGRIISP